MFTIVRTLFFLSVIFLYGMFFSIQDQRSQNREVTLGMALPVHFYRIATGYGKQLAAEMLFVRTSVYLGGVRSGTDLLSYENELANNFEVMTELYPPFIDPYYFCQGFLPPISQVAATRAAGIFSRGITAHPNDLFLRLFYGTNFFLRMDEPLRGAQALSEAAKLPGAPPIFGHLAALLSARGGDIVAGLLSLKTMLEAEEDEGVRTRYAEEIAIFEQALAVQQALQVYAARYGAAPSSLEQLVPEFLQSIPEFKDSFELVYTPPTLHLKRPDRK